MKRKCGKGQWSYAEKGRYTKKYPTYVFLHGIGGSKDHWPIIVRKIPKKYHCIAVDLPGHGFFIIKIILFINF
jgi:pimeloyl-ACP methyl ester carboxylesterase